MCVHFSSQKFLVLSFIELCLSLFSHRFTKPKTISNFIFVYLNNCNLQVNYNNDFFVFNPRLMQILGKIFLPLKGSELVLTIMLLIIRITSLRCYSRCFSCSLLEFEPLSCQHVSVSLESKGLHFLPLLALMLYLLLYSTHMPLLFSSSKVRISLPILSLKQ